MKTIDELVAEVARNEGTANSAPKTQQKLTAKPIEKPIDEVVAEKTVVSVKENPDKLMLAVAKEIAAAVEIAANIIKIKVVCAIVDEGANLMLLHAMDDSYIASVAVAQDKAYTAVALKMPTHKALEESRGGALDGLTNGNGIMLLGGGCPLEKADKIYGGVGVSGGTKEQDIVLSMVAAEIFKARFA